MIANLMPPVVKWRTFLQRQAGDTGCVGLRRGAEIAIGLFPGPLAEAGPEVVTTQATGCHTATLTMLSVPNVPFWLVQRNYEGFLK
jgi:hypothetical protein